MSNTIGARPSVADAVSVDPSLLQQQKPRTSALPPLMRTIRETRSLRYSTRVCQGEMKDFRNDRDCSGLLGKRSSREKGVDIDPHGMVTSEPGENELCSAVGMTTRARQRCCYSASPSNPPPVLSNSRKASGEVKSFKGSRSKKRSKMAETKADCAESEGVKHDGTVAGVCLRNGYKLRSRDGMESNDS